MGDCHRHVNKVDAMYEAPVTRCSTAPPDSHATRLTPELPANHTYGLEQALSGSKHTSTAATYTVSQVRTVLYNCPHSVSYSVRAAAASALAFLSCRRTVSCVAGCSANALECFRCHMVYMGEV